MLETLFGGDHTPLEEPIENLCHWGWIKKTSSRGKDARKRERFEKKARTLSLAPSMALLTPVYTTLDEENGTRTYYHNTFTMRRREVVRGGVDKLPFAPHPGRVERLSSSYA